jgi:multisubunit Na+/H+ antiporter MnhC subunit
MELTALLILGAVVVGCSFTALLVRFSPEAETEAGRAYQAALRQKETKVQPQLEPALT